MPVPNVERKQPVLSAPLLVLCDGIVGAMKSVAPLSFALVVFRVWAYSTGRRQNLLLSRTTLWRRAINVWLVCEALFFVYCKRVGAAAQAQPPMEKVVRLSKAERLALFERCLQTTNSAHDFVESWYRTDHTFEDLKRGNVKEWLAWGLFHIHDWENNMSEDEKDELEVLVQRFEEKCGQDKDKNPSWRFSEGYNSEAKLMKFSEEPVVHSHRPLVMYTAVHFLLQEIITPLRLSLLDFTRMRHKTLYYAIRHGSHPEKVPLVLIHGLGVGILPYEGLIRDIIKGTLDEKSSLFGRSIVCVELHAVSQRLMPAELHRNDFVANMKEIMAKHGYDKGGIIMGHSYGSFATSWLAQRAPEIVHALVLLDPASLFLHFPNVLYSILYLQPTNAYERFIHYLIREELFWNAHARRHFFWYANILFLEDVDTANKPTMVVLSEEDFIVPIRPALKYVQEYNQGKRLTYSKYSSDSKVELLFLPNCDHGGFLWMKDHRTKVMQCLEHTVSKCKA